MVLKLIPIVAGQYFWKGFIKNWSFLEFLSIFKEVKHKIFRIFWKKYLRSFSGVWINLSSPQVKRNYILITKKWIYGLFHKVQNDLRVKIWGDKATSRKCIKRPELMATTQPIIQKASFDNWAKKLQKGKLWSIPKLFGFTWFSK